MWLLLLLILPIEIYTEEMISNFIIKFQFFELIRCEYPCIDKLFFVSEVVVVSCYNEST